MDLSQHKWIEKLESTDNAVILDVRTADEVASGKVEGSINHDIYNPQEFMDAVSGFDKNASYFVYCRSGNRSGQACAILRTQGIENAYNLTGGMLEWEGKLV